MTLLQFATRNVWRNKRRSVLTILSLGFSFLLLTLMMTIWRTFYIDPWSVVSARHIVCRHRVSLAISLPTYYREKLRTIPGVVDVIPLNLFDADYKGAPTYRISAWSKHNDSRASACRVVDDGCGALLRWLPESLHLPL